MRHCFLWGNITTLIDKLALSNFVGFCRACCRVKPALASIYRLRILCALKEGVGCTSEAPSSVSFHLLGKVHHLDQGSAHAD
jgi:hypothetical protein